MGSLNPRTPWEADKQDLADKLTSLFYGVVTPLLNPIIYSLRNKEAKATVRNLVTWKRFTQWCWRAPDGSCSLVSLTWVSRRIRWRANFMQVYVGKSNYTESHYTQELCVNRKHLIWIFPSFNRRFYKSIFLLIKPYSSLYLWCIVNKLITRKSNPSRFIV